MELEIVNCINSLTPWNGRRIGSSPSLYYNAKYKIPPPTVWLKIVLGLAHVLLFSREESIPFFLSTLQAELKGIPRLTFGAKDPDLRTLSKPRDVRDSF